MRIYVLTFYFLCCLFLSGCHIQPLAVASNSTPSSQMPEYETVSMVTLRLGNEVRVKATIENLKESISAVPGQKPRSKLVIRNLSTGKVIYEEECGDSSLSNPDFWIERGAALIMTTKGGSGDGFGVYEVTESDARIVLAEGYRAAAIMMPNDELGGHIGFLIVDAESGTAPLKVRRYEYSEEKKVFVLTGKTIFSQFLRSVQAPFNKVAYSDR